jgi:hypothetical protein
VAAAVAAVAVAAVAVAAVAVAAVAVAAVAVAVASGCLDLVTETGTASDLAILDVRWQ